MSLINKMWTGFVVSLLFTACGTPETEGTTDIEEQPNPQEIDTTSIKLEEEVTLHEVPVFQTVRDTYALQELGYSDEMLPDFISYLRNSPENGYNRWPESYWGRCCTEADMQVTELLNFQITTSSDNEGYPFSNLFDDDLQNAYVFKPEDEVVFNISLSVEGHIQYEDSPLIKDIIGPEDTIVYPFRIGIINGYIKSEKTFRENARIKRMEVYRNDEYVCQVELLEMGGEPEVIQCDFPFLRDDVIRLVPIDYYEGERYTDVCISTMQFNLGFIGNQKLNERYSIYGR